MILDTIVTGSIQENCYLVGDSSELLLIDPGDEAEKIKQRIDKQGYHIKYIVLTHCHWDHIGAVAQMKKITGAELVLCRTEAENYCNPYVNLMESFGANEILPKPNLLVSEGEEIVSGKYRFHVLETPGHTEGGICLFGEACLFSGDTLFQRGMGRVDLPTGNMKKIIHSIQKKLFLLPEEVRVYPGHGAPTTIGYEKKHNEVYAWERMSNEE